MRTIAAPSETFADLLGLLGDVPLSRIRVVPAPGTATEADVEELLDRPDKRLCELIHGVLVEKAMGMREARIGGIVFRKIGNYLDENDIGIISPADGPLRVFPGLVYIPDVSFISDEQLPDGDLPDDAIPDVVPDLAVEEIGEGILKRKWSENSATTSAPGLKLFS